MKFETTTTSHQRSEDVSHNYRDWSEDYTKVYNRSIGHGAFGKVSLVKSNQTGKYFAMKEIYLDQRILKDSLINKSYALDEGFKLIKLGIDHVNIVKYHASYLHNNTIYWLMDYCDGGTLRDRINMYIRQEKSMDESLVWYWSMQILHGLRYIHSKGVIHRDLKPDNVYIESRRGTCKIGDFGFAKLLVDTSITENTTIKYLKSDQFSNNNNNDENDEDGTKKSSSIVEEEKIVYKMINMSQVGTPAYIAPELRMFIDSHLNYSSQATINERLRVCEQHIFRADIFSFGCIVYEMSFLRPAFDNKFQLPESVYVEKMREVESKCAKRAYSSELKNLIKLCLTKSPEDRPNIKQLFSLSIIRQRAHVDYFDAYRRQVVPSLCINTKQNVLACISVNLEEFYKPIAMKSLKFNQNLIVVLAIRHVNQQTKLKNFKIMTSFSPFGSGATTLSKQDQQYLLNEAQFRRAINSTAGGGSSNLSNQTNLMDAQLESVAGSGALINDDHPEDAKLLIYNEFGQLVKEFNSFLLTNGSTSSSSSVREMFNFRIYDFCIDEDHNHLYLSTRRHGILRLRVLENTHTGHYLDELVLDGKLNLDEELNLNTSGGGADHHFMPTCLNLIENEQLFKDSLVTTQKRRLLFYDRASKRVVSVQVDVGTTSTTTSLSSPSLIKCNINAGLTLDQFNVRQMVSTSDELICVFDDLSLINVYNLKTLQLKRSNRSLIGQNEKRNKSLKKNVMCLTLDSANQLYSTNGKSIFNLDYVDFKQKKRISPSIKKGENLSHTICLMTLLTNLKLVLLTDALQMESSMLFILKPVNMTPASTEAAVK